MAGRSWRFGDKKKANIRSVLSATTRPLGSCSPQCKAPLQAEVPAKYSIWVQQGFQRYVRCLTIPIVF